MPTLDWPRVHHPLVRYALRSMAVTRVHPWPRTVLVSKRDKPRSGWHKGRLTTAPTVEGDARDERS